MLSFKVTRSKSVLLGLAVACFADLMVPDAEYASAAEIEKITPETSKEIAQGATDPDGYALAESPIEHVHLALGSDTHVNAALMASPKWMMALFPATIGHLYAKSTGGQLTMLYNNDGTVNEEALKGKSNTLVLEVVDILASQKLAKAFRDAIESDNRLRGKTWADARIQSEVTVELNYADPSDGNRIKTLAICNLQQVYGKSRHKLYFKLTDEAVAAIRESEKDQLHISFVVQAFCKVSTRYLAAEASSLHDSVAKTLNQLASASGNKSAWVITTGGEIDNSSGFKTMLVNRISADIGTKEGAKIPAEVMNAYLDMLMGRLSQVIDLQQQDQSQWVTLVIANQAVLHTPIGAIHSNLESARRLVESSSASDVLDGRSNSLEGGASFMGFGANLGHSSSHQKREMQQRMARELAETSKQFEAKLPAVTAMRISNLNSNSSVDSRSIDFTLSKFSYRWQPLSYRVGFDQLSDHSKRLDELNSKRSQIESEIEKINSEASDRLKQIIDKIDQNKDLATSLDKAYETALACNSFLSRFQGYLEWEIHLAKLGTRSILGTFTSHLNGIHEGTKTRRQYLQEQEQLLNETRTRFQNLLASLCDVCTATRATCNANIESSNALNEKLRELKEVQSEIEQLIRLSAGGR